MRVSLGLLLVGSVAYASPVVVDREYTLQLLERIEKQLSGPAAKRKDAIANVRELVVQLKHQLQGAVATSGGKPAPMEAQHFDELLGKLTRTGIPHERVELLTSVAPKNHYSCEQASTLIALFSLPDERTQVLTLLAPNLVDLQNEQSILVLFPIPSDQERARALLGASANQTAPERYDGRPPE